MRAWKKAPVALALAAGLAGAALTATPAQAAGDGPRVYGCAAHWRVTANWNECINANITVQLQVNCNFGQNWYGGWKTISGSRDPVDRYECISKTNGASNAYTF